MILETATATLLTPFDLEAGKLERVFAALGTRRIDYADLYFQYSRFEGWSLEEGIVKSGSFNIEQGVGVRAVSGDKTAFAYSDEISFNALQDAAKATRAIASAGQSKKTKQGRANCLHLYTAKSTRSPRSGRRKRSRFWRSSSANAARSTRA